MDLKILVIPDVHLKPWMFHRASELMKDIPARHPVKPNRAVCLMDIADDACGIIGLNQESSINTVLECCSLFSLTLEQQKIYFSVADLIIALTEKNAEFMGEIICLCAIIFGEKKMNYIHRKL
mgnify:CR=1 FL=1